MLLYANSLLIHKLFVNLQSKCFNIMIMNPTIDTYRLTSMEEPSDAMLSQLMKEAAEEAKRTNEEATTRFFEQMLEDAQKIPATW